MSNQLKILVCGDVEGKFSQLFKKVSSIQKKAGAFDMLFCVGDFFGGNISEWEAYKSGETKVPVDTFVLGPTKPEHVKYFDDPNGCALCDRVTFLGKKGVYTGSSGLVMAYLSGQDGLDTGNTDITHFTATDVESLSESLCNSTSFRGVDLLFTSCWPRGVTKYGSDITEFKSSEVGSPAVSQLALMLKPRYHLAGQQGVYYERQPYRNHRMLNEASRHVTRFIGMAKVGNTEKKKFLYAFNLVPMKHMSDAELVKQPEDCTECPYRQNAEIRQKAQQIKDKDEKGGQFFYDQGCLDRGDVREQRRGRGRGRGGHHSGQKRQYEDREGDGGPNKRSAEPQGPCWFCLGSPEVEKHLVVSVGTQTYLCLAKGGLTPDHVLITPIGHHQSLTSAPGDIMEEVNKYKAALKRCFKSQGKGVVFFERNYKTSHMQIQVVPIPGDTVEDVKEIFLGTALSQDIELAEIPPHSDLKQIVPPGKPYFYAELPGEEKVFYQIKKGFPLQFGREALAHDSILDMPERVDWRNCKVSKEEEIKMAADFRELFKDYDFNT